MEDDTDRPSFASTNRGTSTSRGAMRNSSDKFRLKLERVAGSMMRSVLSSVGTAPTGRATAGETCHRRTPPLPPGGHPEGFFSSAPSGNCLLPELASRTTSFGGPPIRKERLESPRAGSVVATGQRLSPGRFFSAPAKGRDLATQGEISTEG